ncbi:peroxiredoxin [Phaeobacter inhibens]|uniref:peroxiredoxin family protein n=1 Tax=Phaeobacter inhibens TaxID=221822 RepID=UPI0027717E4F|nr:peroxiredoxin [Phaeobacter inhibens]GLO72848.1 peroxiredoxin [Phaeobacter inhibens]
MKVGSKIPSTPVQQLVDGEIKQINLADFSQDRAILLVAMPGAFTPTCADDHVPGYLRNADAFLAKGVDEIVVLATSDFFVVKTWADGLNPPEHVHFMADGSQVFAKAADQLLDLTDLGLGMRTQRYAAVVRNGSLVSLAVEPDATAVTVSGADAVLSGL